MRKLLRSAIIGAGMAGACAAIATSALAQSATLTRKAPDADALAAKLQSGAVDVIIELDAAPVTTTGDDTAKAGGKARLRSLQDDVLAKGLSASASALSKRAIKRMSIMPMIGLRATASELERLAADPRVKAIHLDEDARPHLSQSVPVINSERLVNAGIDGSNRIVAVLDSGVQFDHPFFGGRILSGACFSTTEGDYSTTCPSGATEQIDNVAGKPCSVDRCDHGTHVAGIVAGFDETWSGDKPDWGVARGAHILPVQIFSKLRDGNSTVIVSRSSDQIRALEWVLEKQRAFPGKTIDAVNMSIGGAAQSGACDSDAVASTILTLRNNGIAVVISAGNDGSRNGVSAPGCISHAITVGNTTDQDRVSDTSNIGAQVDVLAPGTKIFSSVPSKSFAEKNGTSMAAPHVAGAIALLRSKNPFATVGEIETALETTGLGVTDQRSSGTITKPRIRVFEAAERLPKSTISVTAQGSLAFAPDLRGRYQPASVRLEVRMTGASATGWHVEGVPPWLSVSGASTLTNGGLAIVTVAPTAQAANVARDTTITLKFVNDGNRSQSPVQIPVSIKAANMNI